MDQKLLAVAGGKEPADLVVKNGKIVNVFSGEIYDGGVAVAGDKIAAVGDVDYTIGEGTKILDAQGKYLTPGFIDGHIHPESSNLAIRSFAEAVLKHGTTVIMTDLHEIGVVGGLEAIEAVLKEAEATDLKLYFIVPSHVPFSPNLETSGGRFDTEIIKRALERPDAVGLSECVGMYLAAGFPELMASCDAALAKGKSLQGHLPDADAATLNTCVAAGVSTDHESLSGKDVVDRLRAGCSVMLREGSSARSLTQLLEPVLADHLDTSNLSIVTDDLHTIDLATTGHLDESVRTALKAGVEFLTAIQMVTINAARAFQLDRFVGCLAPGRRADINLTTGPEDFRVDTVVAGGRVVAQGGESVVHYPVVEHNPILLNTVHLKRCVEAADFQIRVSESARAVKVKVMDTLPWIPITQPRDVELNVVDGVVQCDLDQDVLYIAQVERHGKTGGIGKAFMGGFKLKKGAIASSMGHDNHNIIVMGANHADMAAAVNRVAALQGGQVFVVDGEVLCEIPFPVCGLQSDLSAEELAEEKRKFNATLREHGCEISYTCMFLSFICLAAIPLYAITDKGFIDVFQQKVIDPILEVLE
ncbi:MULTISPECIES: adenine deaminase [unclassified Oscillibacter]|uniref:adenine deaminase n=1 Tax=unclassified Oscillibacter TaxID=2629304 RepID=UPI0025D07DBD|nr:MULTISPECIES: adenine deaminase C-terminal domain-containing protein [unclassified Oscillibacter]